MLIAPDKRSVVHSTFSVERTYPVSPARVFAAFSNPATKRRWFVEGEGWQIDEYQLDFRIGGHEISRFRFQGGAPMHNDTIYLDIVPEQRIIFAYSMTISDAPLSASLATVELVPAGGDTRLIYTEQGAFLDGADSTSRREHGCRSLLERLGEELAARE
jgi:uncharacterized protein YndB with AHSA1/START domain